MYTTPMAKNTREKVIRNFVKNYGQLQLKWLVRQFQSGVSGQAVANQFDVSREQIRVWKNTFGQTFKEYRLYPEIVHVRGERKDRRE